jgi:hypothetical protein
LAVQNDSSNDSAEKVFKRFDLALLVDWFASHRTAFIYGCLGSHTDYVAILQRNTVLWRIRQIGLIEGCGRDAT